MNSLPLRDLVVRIDRQALYPQLEVTAYCYLAVSKVTGSISDCISVNSLTFVGMNFRSSGRPIITNRRTASIKNQIRPLAISTSQFPHTVQDAVQR